MRITDPGADLDPRFDPVQGLRPQSVAGYYRCCPSDGIPADLVGFRLPDGRWTEFLLGRVNGPYPRGLWLREGMRVPYGVVVEFVDRWEPCTRPADPTPHLWTMGWRWFSEGEFYTYRDREDGVYAADAATAASSCVVQERRDGRVTRTIGVRLG